MKRLIPVDLLACTKDFECRAPIEQARIACCEAEGDLAAAFIYDRRSTTYRLIARICRLEARIFRDGFLSHPRMHSPWLGLLLL
jgi:hypothetical protein